MHQFCLYLVLLLQSFVGAGALSAANQYGHSRSLLRRDLEADPYHVAVELLDRELQQRRMMQKQPRRRNLQLSQEFDQVRLDLHERATNLYPRNNDVTPARVYIPSTPRPTRSMLDRTTAAVVAGYENNRGVIYGSGVGTALGCGFALPGSLIEGQPYNVAGQVAAIITGAACGAVVDSGLSPESVVSKAGSAIKGKLLGNNKHRHETTPLLPVHRNPSDSNAAANSPPLWTQVLGRTRGPKKKNKNQPKAIPHYVATPTQSDRPPTRHGEGESDKGIGLQGMSGAPATAGPSKAEPLGSDKASITRPEPVHNKGKARVATVEDADDDDD